MELVRWLPGIDEAADSPLRRPDEGLEARLTTRDGAEPPPMPPQDLPPAWALPACMATLRAAGEELRRLPVEARIAGIARVARSWLDPDDPSRLDALQRLPEEAGLHEGMVAWGLDRAFEEVSIPALRAWWSSEGGASDDGPRLSAHVQAGNVFAAGLPPVVASLLAGVPAIIKAPAAQPTFAALLARSFALHAPELGPCVGAASWPRDDELATAALLRADVVFAFGSDASVEAIEALAPPSTTVLRFGHRFSVAALPRELLSGPAGALDEALDGLLADVLAWDGGGCLTPRWTFVEGTAADAERLAHRCAERIEPILNALPALPLSPGAGAERAAWLAETAFSGWSAYGPGWGVASLPAARLLPMPPGRVACFLPVTGWDDVEAALQPLGSRLQGLAWAGPDDRRQELAERLGPLGLSRVCAPGELQRPPINWNHDDVRLLTALR